MRDKHTDVEVPRGVSSLKKSSDMVEEIRQYTLITPLFGGGVQPRSADPLTRVRVSSIRGQLRFWWRATRGVGTLQKVREEEFALWGAASRLERSQPSQVQIALLSLDRPGTEERPFGWSGKEPKPLFQGIVSPHYAAFPLQPSTQELREARDPASIFPAVVKDIQFKIRVRYPSCKQGDMEATFWAWETLGGVGGRTRRGFGALRLDKLERDGKNIDVLDHRPSGRTAQELDAWMTACLKKHVAEGVRDDALPCLSLNKRWRFFSPDEVKREWPRVLSSLGKIQKEEAQALSQVPPGAQMAWQLLVQKLRRFRQARPAFPYENSEWPEADALRKLTGACFPKHEPRARGVKVLDVYPRAALGLPIVLHFKNGPDKTGKRGAQTGPAFHDPADHTLVAVTSSGGDVVDRFASPLLLRPVVCRDGGVAALAFALRGPVMVLDTGAVKGGQPAPLAKIGILHDKNLIAEGKSFQLTREDASQISPLWKLGEHEQQKPSLIRAFLNFLRVESTPKPSK